MSADDLFETGWRRVDYRGGRRVWFVRRMARGRTLSISQPSPGALCRQWFVAISNQETGACIDSTHTTHRPKGQPRDRSERSAKAWATAWATKREETLRRALEDTP